MKEVKNTEDLALVINEIREKFKVWKGARKSYKRQLESCFSINVGKEIKYKFGKNRKVSKPSEDAVFQFLRTSETFSSRRRSSRPDVPGDSSGIFG